jgi:hypothetical protein
LGYVSAIDSSGRTILIADAHRDDGKRFVVRAEEKPEVSFHKPKRAVRLERIGQDIWAVSSKPAQRVELPKVQILGDSAYPDAFDFSPNSQSGLDSLAIRSAVRLAVVSHR